MVAVDALQGLDDAVNCVEGLLILLMDDEAGSEGRTWLAAKACNSGMSLGGSVAGGYVDAFSGTTIPRTVSSSMSTKLAASLWNVEMLASDAASKE